MEPGEKFLSLSLGKITLDGKNYWVNVPAFPAKKKDGTVIPGLYNISFAIRVQEKKEQKQQQQRPTL